MNLGPDIGVEEVDYGNGVSDSYFVNVKSSMRFSRRKTHEPTIFSLRVVTENNSHNARHHHTVYYSQYFHIRILESPL